MQLKAAIQAHTNQVNRCANGHDVDRHLYALYCLWSKYHAKSHTRHVGADKLKRAKTISDLHSESEVTGSSAAAAADHTEPRSSTESRSSTEPKSSAGFLSLFGGGKDKSKASRQQPPTTAPKRSAQEFLAGMDLEQPELAERAGTLKMDVDMARADDDDEAGGL
jgi:hypothetical protein